MGKGRQRCAEFVCMGSKSRALSTNGNQKEDKSVCLIDEPLIALYMALKLSRWLVCLFPSTKNREYVLISQYALKS